MGSRLGRESCAALVGLCAPRSRGASRRARVREGAELSLFLGLLPFLVRPQLLCKKCAYRKRCLVRDWGFGRPGERRIEELCRV